MTTRDFASNALIDRLRAIVGRRHVLTRPAAMHLYVTGFRSGSGAALAVVRPGSLVEQWRVAQACVAADVILIVQAANTGLTGGSTPSGEYDRPVVLLSTSRIGAIHLIRDGRQVVCAGGVSLYELERALKTVGRDPHSVIGSSCFGASVIGGVCNNSGGALIHRGPSFTQYALFARADDAGRLELHNHLGIRLGGSPEEMLASVEAGRFVDAEIDDETDRKASDDRYVAHVRQVDADSPARFNADPRGHYEASGSAGRLIVFAVRLDSFARPDRTATFYLGTNDPAVFGRFRREVLKTFRHVPTIAEYIHRDAFDLAEHYGRDIAVAIDRLGTARLPALFRAKAKVDAIGRRFWLGEGLSDRLLQAVSRVLPRQVPPRMRSFQDRFAHHLIVQVVDEGVEEMRDYLARSGAAGGLDHFECSAEEGRKALLHRFVVAGAAVRYRAVHRANVQDIIALDVALPRNATDWTADGIDDAAGEVLHKIYYGHFFCHVFHRDYVVATGVDTTRLKVELLRTLDELGAEYPAEHNVGHQYQAKPALKIFYRRLDPGNRLNPGIGHTSRNRRWT